MNKDLYEPMLVSNEAVNFLDRNYIGNSELNIFLQQWDENYKSQAEEIALFDSNLVKNWSKNQRKTFIKIFYHSRGYFRDFLWHLGNFAPDKMSKDMILENIQEEFNDDHLSHEQLYLNFARQEGVDLSDEYINKHFYIKKMQDFNEVHIKWLYAHKEWDSKLAAFSAYERLDSTDYELLSASLFSHEKHEHEFFKIHRQAKHFDKTYISLLKVWHKNKRLVEEAFDFIALTQLEMWKDLYDEVLFLAENSQ